MGSIARIARELSEPILECVGRNDTSHPVFHGCIDWHSAVHGNYALRVASRLTGDPSYRNAANRVANPTRLTAELESIRAGKIRQEIPYGYAWFLILDREAGRNDMAPLASTMAEQLRRWIDEGVDSDDLLLAPEYQNLSFAVFALHRWYVRFAPDTGTSFRAEIAPQILAHSSEICMSSRSDNAEFFDPCATLLLALSDIDATQDRLVSDDTLRDLYQTVVLNRPLAPTEIHTAHAAGLNFSRSWSFYATAAALEDPAAIEAGDNYFIAQLEAPELWRDNYQSYGHWVAQFGVHALDLRSEAVVRLLRR